MIFLWIYLAGLVFWVLRCVYCVGKERGLNPTKKIDLVEEAIIIIGWPLFLGFWSIVSLFRPLYNLGHRKGEKLLSNERRMYAAEAELRRIKIAEGWEEPTKTTLHRMEWSPTPEPEPPLGIKTFTPESWEQWQEKYSKEKAV